MVENRELQEKILAYRILESRLDAMLKQRNMLASKLLEIQTTLQSIDEIKKGGGEILFPVGSEAYIFGKITDKKKLIIGIGANVALEKSVEESKIILNKRKAEIENALNGIQKNIAELSTNLSQLGPEIEKLTKGQQKATEGG